MILPDVNVLVGAHRQDQAEFAPMREWLEGEISSSRPFVLADVAVAGYLRIVTNPRIYAQPASLEIAIGSVNAMIEQPTCLNVGAGARHWPILRELLEGADARGNLVPDAHLAAIAVEHGATVATRDRGFARFPGVPWFDPLAA